MNNTSIRCPVWGVVVGAACLLLTAFLAGCGESGAVEGPRPAGSRPPRLRRRPVPRRPRPPPRPPRRMRRPSRSGRATAVPPSRFPRG